MHQVRWSVEPATPKGVRNVVHWLWGIIKQVWGIIKQATLTGVLILTLILIGVVLLILEMRRDYVSIEPIQVPKKLEDRGYTPRVAAQQLIDNFQEIRERASTVTTSSTPIGVPMESNWSRADFVLPAVGLSIRATATYLRDLLGLPVPVVRGELLETESGNQVSLRLRLDGKKVADILGETQKTAMDQLFKKGTHQFLKVKEPYTLALYYYALASDYNRASAEYGTYRSKIDDLLSFILSKRVDIESTIRALNLQGILLSENKKFDEAIEKYEQAAKLNSTDAWIYYNWGVTLANKGDYAEAAEKYEQAAKLNPTDARIYHNWGAVLDNTGDYAEAAEKYEQAAKLNPKYVGTYYNWGAVLLRTGDYAGAAEKYEQAAELRPKDVRMYRNWGTALYYAGDYAGAAEKYEQAAKLNPTDARIYRYWGEALANTGDHAGAAEKYEQAAKLNPTDARIYRYWGEALANTGDHAGAIEKYQRAEELGLKTAGLYRNWGAALANTRRPCRGHREVRSGCET